MPVKNSKTKRSKTKKSKIKINRPGRNIKLWFVLAAAAVGIVLTLALRAAEPVVSTSDPIPPTFFGMHAMSHNTRPAVPFGSLGKGVAISWFYIETSKGNYDWQQMDVWVQSAQAQGKSFFYSNSGVPRWAAANTSQCAPVYSGAPERCNSMVRDINDYRNFMTALASRYKGKLIYELWNEPNTEYFTNITHAQMAQLANVSAQAIRAVDPEATIIAPSGDPGYMDRFWTAGGTKDVDAVTVHSYYSVPEMVLNDLTGMKNVMVKHGIGSKPIWDTEGSWGMPQYYGTPDDKPGFVARYHLLHWSGGATRFYWYAWENSDWGTLNNDPASANAYTQTYNWMVGARMDKPCVKASDGNTWTCHLVRASNYQALPVWNTAGNKSFTVPSGYTKYRDLSGATVAVTAGQSVTIGKRPILLEGTATSPSPDPDPEPEPTPTPTNDNVAPSVSITSPSPGQTVSGTVQITASASDNVGVTSLELYISGTRQTQGSASSYSWDTTKFANGTYILSAKAYDAAGNIGYNADDVVVTVNNGATTPPPPPPTGTGNGLSATYWDSMDMTGPALNRIDQTVNFDWQPNTPDSRIAADTFSARWVGTVTPTTSGTYTFYTQTDDGVVLYVNGQRLINNYTDHGATEDSGTITLTAGKAYDIRMDYYENGGWALAKLLWSGPSVTKQIIPKSQLGSQPLRGLKATYFNNMDFTGTAVSRFDALVNFDWKTGSPDFSLGADTFSARWTGKVLAAKSERYTFYVSGDDGVRLWINNRLVANGWSDHGVKEFSGTYDMVAGQKYDIKMEYYDNGGAAVSRLRWSSPSTSKATVPWSRLYTQ